MDIENYQFRYDAYKNNTFDLDIVEKSIEESKLSAYQYLRQFQLESTGYKRFDFKMQEIYRTNKVNHTYTLTPRKWVFYIEHEFINVGKRLSYKRSDLYEKELSFDKIVSRPDLFDSTFIVFIDGVLYLRGIDLLCKEDKTYLIINCKEKPSRDGITVTDMHRFIEDDVNVTVFFIPNIGIKNISTNAYRLRTLNSSTGIPNRILNLDDNVDYTNALSFIRHINSVNSIAANGELTNNGLIVDKAAVDEMININPNNTALDITLIPLRNLLTKIHVNKGDKWFEIPIQDYPVAVENCLITTTNGTFVHDARISHYYPNIYSIENVDDILNENDMYIYIFYFENKYNQLKHLDMLAAYHKYVPDYLDRYRNDTINPLVKNFEPMMVNYNIKDFKKSVEYDDHFKYKISKMKEFIKADPNNFKRYLKNLGLGNNYYYVDVSKIDLNQRKRVDNKDTKLRPEKFEEEMYMFVFRNDFRGMYDELIIHVDGTRYQEKIQLYRTDMLDYIYIPCKLVNHDSVLEIEKISEVKKELPFKANSIHDIIRINIGEFAVRNKTLYNDLFVVDRATGEYIDPEVYQIILPVKFHMDDIESDIVLDYVITENDNGYLQLAVLDHGLINVFDSELNDAENAFYLSLQSNDNKFYQFDVDNNEPKFNKVDLVNGYVTNKVRSMDKKMVYQFKMVDGVVKIEMMEDDGTGKTLAEGGLNLVDTQTVFLQCPTEIKMRILDSDYVGRDLALHIKKNHNYEVIEDDLLSDEMLVYNIDGTPIKIRVLRDQTRARFPSIKYKNFYLTNKNNELFKVDINKGRLQTTFVDSIDEDNDYLVADTVYLLDIIDNNVYKVLLNDENIISTEQYTDNDKVVINDKIQLMDVDGYYFSLLTYRGNLATAGLNFDRDPNLDYYPILFKTWSKNDPRYFRVYQNGRLLPRHISTVNFPKYCLFTDVELLLGIKKEPDVLYKIAVECMPYMMNQVCYIEDIPRDKVINLKGLIDKPFDFKWYDVYVNGKKIVKKDIEVISANIIKLLKTDSLHGLEIIENSRDTEYFGGFDAVYDIIDELFDNDKLFHDNLNKSIDNNNISNKERPIEGGSDNVIDAIDYLIRQLYDYLVPNFGFINPDLLQLSQIELSRFNKILSDNGPLLIGSDNYGENRIGIEMTKLSINPDE